MTCSPQGDGRTERVEQPRQAEQQQRKQQQQRGKLLVAVSLRRCGTRRQQNRSRIAASRQTAPLISTAWSRRGRLHFCAASPPSNSIRLCRMGKEYRWTNCERVNDLVAGGGAAKIRIHAGLEAFIRRATRATIFALPTGGVESGGQFLRAGVEEMCQ